MLDTMNDHSLLYIKVSTKSNNLLTLENSTFKNIDSIQPHTIVKILSHQ